MKASKQPTLTAEPESAPDPHPRQSSCTSYGTFATIWACGFIDSSTQTPPWMTRQRLPPPP
jgi:hypothetical protein